jgi:hypothetical protein
MCARKERFGPCSETCARSESTHSRPTPSVQTVMALAHTRGTVLSWASVQLHGIRGVQLSTRVASALH